MTDIRSSVASIVDRTKPVANGEPVFGLHFLGQKAVFVLGEEALLFAGADGSARRVAVHDGAILSACASADHVITGGDDGKVVRTDASGETGIVATDDKRRWIDHVAAGPDGAVAWSAGRFAYVRSAKGEQREIEVLSTVGALAFAPKGFRLAIAHYNGATLWFPNAAADPETLLWKGSHLGITVSPNGKFLVTAMQEPVLHGWRLADSKNMRMSGYDARIRSMAWTANGEYLATGGSSQLILWPFTGKDGPMGKQPLVLAPHSDRLVAVAAHPTEGVVAAGFADGMVLLVRLSDGAEILAKRPGKAPVSALAFSADGRLFAFGCEDGEAGIIDLG